MTQRPGTRPPSERRCSAAPSGTSPSYIPPGRTRAPRKITLKTPPSTGRELNGHGRARSGKPPPGREHGRTDRPAQCSDLNLRDGTATPPTWRPPPPRRPLRLPKRLRGAPSPPPMVERPRLGQPIAAVRGRGYAMAAGRDVSGGLEAVAVALWPPGETPPPFQVRGAERGGAGRPSGACRPGDETRRFAALRSLTCGGIGVTELSRSEPRPSRRRPGAEPPAVPR